MKHLPLSALRSRYQRLQGAFERALPASDPRPLDFYPPLLRLTDSPLNPIGRKVLWLLLSLLAALLLWALIGRLDIVAVAEGKLVPYSYLKIVQPADSGIVKEILVREGDTVQADKLAQEVAKQAHRQSLMELKATQDSVVNDLSTHTTGTVVQPGTVLLTLVPKEETLRAEVWVSNEDIGFVRQGQPVKLKFTAFPFQKYGLVDGVVEHVSADSADSITNKDSTANDKAPARSPPLFYKVLLTLKAMQLEMDEQRFALGAGMQTQAEILLGTRSVMEFLLSPVRKAWHEAGRER